MDTASLPETIATIIAQAGGFGLRGAIAYVEAHRFAHRYPKPTGECRASRPSRLVKDPAPGWIDYGVGLKFRVNGKWGKAWIDHKTVAGQGGFRPGKMRCRTSY